MKAPKYFVWRKEGGERITYLAINEKYDMWVEQKSTAKQFTLISARKNITRLSKMHTSVYSSTVYGKELV
jgi:hypothetical protein